jgi:hypothetical protein
MTRRRPVYSLLSIGPLFGVALILCVSAPGFAQTVLRGHAGAVPSLVGSDLAVLEAKEPRKDLPCVVSPNKPLLGFDLRFHGSFDISLPLRELAGSENTLTILFRVTPLDSQKEPVYFTQKIRVPPIEEDAKGDAYLHGAFDVGEGKYQVDWLMRDRTERVCAFFWDAAAELPVKDKGLDLEMKPGDIAAIETEQFMADPPSDKPAGDDSIHVKVLVNFAPQNSLASSLQPADTSALVSILRTIQRDPRISKVSLVAFNLQEQKVLYRQPVSEQIDFPAVGEAIRNLQLGRVDIGKLQQKNSEAEFLGGLFRDELKDAGGVPPDAVIIAGPKVMLDASVPVESLRIVGEPTGPVFYLNYNLNPNSNPWRDSIGQAVRFFKGQEYTISRPRDLWFAVSEMVSRIVKWKSGKRSSASATPRGTHEAAVRPVIH